jgi:hypothetical protein
MMTKVTRYVREVDTIRFTSEMAAAVKNSITPGCWGVRDKDDPFNWFVEEDGSVRIYVNGGHERIEVGDFIIFDDLYDAPCDVRNGSSFLAEGWRRKVND